MALHHAGLPSLLPGRPPYACCQACGGDTRRSRRKFIIIAFTARGGAAAASMSSAFSSFSSLLAYHSSHCPHLHHSFGEWAQSLKSFVCISAPSIFYTFALACLTNRSAGRQTLSCTALSSGHGQWLFLFQILSIFPSSPVAWMVTPHRVKFCSNVALEPRIENSTNSLQILCCVQPLQQQQHSSLDTMGANGLSWAALIHPPCTVCIHWLVDAWIREKPSF